MLPKNVKLSVILFQKRGKEKYLEKNKRGN